MSHDDNQDEVHSLRAELQDLRAKLRVECANGRFGRANFKALIAHSRQQYDTIVEQRELIRQQEQLIDQLLEAGASKKAKKKHRKADHGSQSSATILGPTAG